MRALVMPLARFFAKQPYRFLWVTLMGACLMIAGAVACYREMEHEVADSKTGLWISVSCFALYVTCGVWYWYRIRAGTWQRFWYQFLEESR